MSDYLDIANSPLIFVMGAVVISFVLLQSVIFLTKAWKRGCEIGMDRKKMIDAVKSSAVFSIVPSLPIVISLIAMAPVLGIPFPWIRLSIVGSAPYELMSAEIGAKSMGISGLGGEGYTAEVFANSMWVMTVGIIWGLLSCIFFLKKYVSRVDTARKKDSAWVTILISALYFGMISVFLGAPIVKGGIALYTMISSAAIMVLLTLAVRKFKLEFLNNFSLAISMVGGMALAVLYSNI